MNACFVSVPGRDQGEHGNAMHSQGAGRLPLTPPVAMRRRAPLFLLPARGFPILSGYAQRALAGSRSGKGRSAVTISSLRSGIRPALPGAARPPASAPGHRGGRLSPALPWPHLARPERVLGGAKEAVAVVATTAVGTVTVADLVAKLEAGVAEVATSDGWRAYLAAQAKFHQYSLGNVLLVLAQKPDATRLAGFHTWLHLGRHVRKGEHGIRILAPVAVRRAAAETESVDPEDEPETHTVTRFRAVTVFDISQTEGDPLPEHPCQALTTDSERGRWLYARLLNIAKAEGIAVSDQTTLRHANGVFVPGANMIGLKMGLSDDHKAKTLCHELAHALLHRTTGKPRPEMEAEAEGTAFVVAAWAGLDTSQYSFGYVADWAAQKDGPTLVRRVGSTIQRTAQRIIAALDPAAGANSARETA